MITQRKDEEQPHAYCLGNERIRNIFYDENGGDPITGKRSKQESGKGRRKTFGNDANEDSPQTG
eukprot:14763257-Heterocapsa_arctica.AAC.1